MRHFKQSGDTIVEVLISVTILALVLAVSFASTSRSLHSGTDASNRQQALELAQQQVEVIRNDVNLGNISKYDNLSATTQAHFCVVGTQVNDSTAANAPCKLSTQYNISDSYDKNSGLFTINSNWPGTGSSSQANLTLHFVAPTPNKITASYVPTVSMSSPCNGLAKDAGTTCNIAWTITNSTSCRASSTPITNDWSGGQSSVPIAPQSNNQNITFSGNTTTYSIICQNGSLTASASITILINAPLQLTFCGDSYGAGACSGNSPSNPVVFSGGATVLRWSIANAASCTSSGFPGPTGNGNSVYTTGAIGSTTSYSISCSGVDGTNQSRTVTATNPPPPTNPQQSCSADGRSATISWTKAPGYSSNYVRLYDNTAGAWVEYYIYGDGQAENYQGSSYSWASTPGHAYEWWIHTNDTAHNGAWSSTVGTTEGGGTLSDLVCPSPQSAPTCSSAGPDGATVAYNATSHTIYAYGVSANATLVKFPTWTDVNGQDDIVWYSGTNDGGGQWHVTINPSSHSGYGYVHVHVYMDSANFTNTWCDTADFNKGSPPPPPSISVCANDYGNAPCWGPFGLGFECPAIDIYADGDPTCGAISNDAISSIVPNNDPGHTLVVLGYWDSQFQADCNVFYPWTYNGNTSVYWSETFGHDWNDVISSFRVRQNGTGC